MGPFETRLLRAAGRQAPVRVAVVGSGPSGAYAAEHLLKDTDREIEVDVFERLPTPWGLVRAGVAPDHPKIKSVTRIFERTAAHARFSFFGNVELGTHVTRDELLARYTAVVYAVGTPADRPMAIPGEDLAGSLAATDLVGWYNGHPDQRDLDVDLSSRRAIVIGNGNVALDVARMLALDPAELRTTDIADHAIAALERSRIEEVVVVGRRGPEQAAFTTPELRELGALSGADVRADADELEVPAALRDPHAGEAARRNLEILRAYAVQSGGAQRRRIVLRFMLSPTRVIGERRVEAVELVRNVLERTDDRGLRARATDARATVPTGLVIRAIGYRGTPLEGLPFDELRGLIPNVGGRVVGAGGPLAREYVVGWAKRGPVGVIGTNKKCALETVRTLIEDLREGRLVGPPQPTSSASMGSLLATRQPRMVSFAGWQTIDRHEQQAGEAAGCPRVKLTRVKDMLDVAETTPRDADERLEDWSPAHAPGQGGRLEPIS